MWRGEKRETPRINLSHPRVRTTRPRKLRENVYIIESLLSRAWLSTRPIKITICSMDRFACKLKRVVRIRLYRHFSRSPALYIVFTRHRFPYIAVGKRSVCTRTRCIAENKLVRTLLARESEKAIVRCSRYDGNVIPWFCARACVHAIFCVENYATYLRPVSH